MFSRCSLVWKDNDWQRNSESFCHCWPFDFLPQSFLKEEVIWGIQVAESVKHLTLTQAMISSFWDLACHSAGSLLLSAPPPACVLFFNLSLKRINKIFTK